MHHYGQAQESKERWVFANQECLYSGEEKGNQCLQDIEWYPVPYTVTFVSSVGQSLKAVWFTFVPIAPGLHITGVL